ncbi:hypothetical protein D9M68_703970 [compost metagenome]
MVAFILTLFAGKFILMTICNQVKFAAYDRLHYRLFNLFTVFIRTYNFGIFPGFGNELEYTKHITMVGNGNSRHIVLLCLFIKLSYVGSSIK